MKTILISVGLTSACWLVFLAYVLIRNFAKNKEMKRQLAAAKYYAEAMQKEFERFKKTYEKMETGNTNNDFMGSLDILQNPNKNGSGKPPATRSYIYK